MLKLGMFDNLYTLTDTKTNKYTVIRNGYEKPYLAVLFGWKIPQLEKTARFPDELYRRMHAVDVYLESQIDVEIPGDFITESDIDKFKKTHNFER